MGIFAINLSTTIYVQEDDKTNYYALELLRTPSARNGQAIRASVYATLVIVQLAIMWNAILVAAQRTLDVFVAASAVSHIISKIATAPIIKPTSVAKVIAADDKNEKPLSDMRCECSTSQLR